MKKIFTSFCMLACMAFISMEALALPTTLSAQFVKTGSEPMAKMSQKAAETTPASIASVDSYGFLKGLDGTDWTYTAKYTYDGSHISGVAIDVYDNNNKLVGKVNETFELEPTDLWVNNISISPVLTKKFFNFDTKVEIILFIYVATKDYTGRYFNNVYSLDPTASTKVCTMPGNMVLAQNLTPNAANDNFVMAFYRNAIVTDTVTGVKQNCYCYDIYEKAGYGTNGAKLVHTFNVPYDNIKALNDPMPLIMVPDGSKMNYFVAQYAKPYFVPGTSVYEDPEVTPDNTFIITHYDNKFNVLNETKIPMVKDPDPRFLYTFYQLGSLGSSNDVILNYNNTGKPAYVITFDNYEIASDGSVNSYYLFDVEGNKINTVAEHTLGTIYLNDIVGQPTQYAFLKNDNKEYIRFVDVPTCEVVADIDLYNGGDLLSNNIDRVPKGDSYQYVIALLQGDAKADGTTEQRVAWFNKNGTLNHYDKLNLGYDIELAQVNINAQVLNPRLFHTDDAYEYMVLLKRNQMNTSAKEEVLIICNNEGQIIREWGANEEMGGKLAMIYVINIHSNPTLVCTYSDGKTSTIHYIPLPLATTKMLGSGTPADPYQISCVSDFMQIENAPTACYKVVNHIDFGATSFTSLEEPFLGKLDGGNYAFYNLHLENGGLFNELYDSAVVKNLFLEQPVMVLTADDKSAGFIANTVRGGVNSVGTSYSALLQNIHLIEPVIEAADFASNFGGLTGEASLYTQIVECSVADASFIAPKAERVGGIAGSLATSSSVNAAFVSGKIEGGKVVGGITATISSAENVTNCHVEAVMAGAGTIGGIVGESGRGLVANCVAEGTLTFTGETEGGIGGIVGHLEADATATATDPCVQNCLVAISAITYPTTAEVVAHRVVGLSSADEFEYDWDNVDYNKPQSEWPKIYFPTETCLDNNYVVTDLAVVDATIAAAHNTTEGAALTADEFTQEWLAAHNYVLGNNVQAPWILDEGTLYLWFEGANSTLDVENVITTPAITINNGSLEAEGPIAVYNISGMLVAQGIDVVSTQNLNAGVYIVAVKNNNSATTCKVLIP